MKILSDELVTQLRSEHGWAKETIREIEAHIIRAAQEGGLPPLPPLDGFSAGRVIRMDQCYGMMREYANLALAAAGGGVPQGWKLVPVEPTHTMLYAMSGEWHPSRHEKMRQVYGLALVNAPASPQPEAAPAVAQVPPNNDVDLLLRQVFSLCEATEDAPEVEPKNEHQRGFDKGRRFAAKQIRRSIGDWFQAEFCGRSFMGEPVVAAAPEAPAQGITTEAGIAWQSGAWPVERKAVMVDGRRWYRDDHERVVPEAPAQADPWPSSEQASLAKADANLLGRGFTVDGVRVAPERVVVVKPEAPAQAAQSAGEVERGDVVAFEFYNRATGHAIVDYSVNTHVGNLSADKGYEARPLVYAAKREEVADGSKPIPLWQAREALDELEAAARGDAPFNHQAAAVVRAALSHKEPKP